MSLLSDEMEECLDRLSNGSLIFDWRGYYIRAAAVARHIYLRKSICRTIAAILRDRTADCEALNENEVT